MNSRNQPQTTIIQGIIYFEITSRNSTSRCLWTFECYQNKEADKMHSQSHFEFLKEVILYLAFLTLGKQTRKIFMANYSQETLDIQNTHAQKVTQITKSKRLERIQERKATSEEKQMLSFVLIKEKHTLVKQKAPALSHNV